MTLLTVDIGVAEFSLLFDKDRYCISVDPIWAWAKGRHLSDVLFRAQKEGKYKLNSFK
jgi:hypothetical protein